MTTDELDQLARELWYDIKNVQYSDEQGVAAIFAAVDQARTIWISDAHRGDGKRFVVHAGCQARPYKLRYNSANCFKQLFFPRQFPQNTFDRISRHVPPRGGFLLRSLLRLSEIASVFVRFDHVASRIVNADHRLM
jgi:hypothetical protein